MTRRPSPAAPTSPTVRSLLPPTLLLGLALAVLLALGLLVRDATFGPTPARVVDDLTQAVAATAAALSCLRRARRSTPAQARPWWWYAAATGAWALGQYAWSLHEAVSRGPGRFPSLWDLCFPLFPVLGSAGLLRWPHGEGRGSLRWRALLDGVLVAAALFIVAWTASVRTLVGDGRHAFASAAALVMPAADLAHLTLAAVVLAHTRRARSGLTLLVAALACLWLTDWSFAYLTATGRYATGSAIDVGWVLAMLLVAAAAHVDRAGRPAHPREPAMESTVSTLLPYLPATVGLVIAMGEQLTSHGDQVTSTAAAVVVGALVLRQLLAVLDHRALVRQVLAARDALEHQALHDPLTGLPNRALFGVRLRQGLERHRRDGEGLGLLYVDLDDFKAVNDTLGHDAGDLVLQDVAVRLQAVTRAVDTVARLGGDEFAVLLAGGLDPQVAAARVVEALVEPVPVGPTLVPVGASIGAATVRPEEPTPSTEALLRRADRAMYDVKRAGRREGADGADGSGDRAARPAATPLTAT